MPTTVYVPCPECAVKGLKYAQLMPTGSITGVSKEVPEAMMDHLLEPIDYHRVEMKCNVCGKSFFLRLYLE